MTFADATATDNCGMGAPTVSQTGGPASGSVFPVGVTTVMFMADDGNGNTDTCSFTVTVNDNEDPVITCPADITVNNDPGNCSAVVTFADATATDNCTTTTVTQTAGPASGSIFPVGTTTVSFMVDDGSSNTDSCSFTVTVNDTEDPEYTNCINDFSVNNDPGLCSAVVTYAAPTPSDNCGVASSVLTSGLPSGAAFPVGDTTVIYTVTDTAGNTSICDFVVTVDDVEAPSITCPTTINIDTDLGECFATVNYSATASDNCPLPVDAISFSIPTGSTFGVGTTTVTATVIDDAMLTDTCTFDVVVTDNEDPVPSCPANIVVNNDAGQCGANVAFSVSSTDNCPGVTESCDANSGDFFPVGTTTVNCTAMDAAGNTGTCSFTVTVNDNEMPTISNCPGPIVMTADSGACSAMVSFMAPMAMDNCPGESIMRTQGPPPGSNFPVGTTTVEYMAMDTNGNTSLCTFTVEVTDDEDPVLSACPMSDTVPVDPGQCTAVYNFTAPTAVDNCPGVSVVQTAGPASGSAFPTGPTDVTFTATDASGNTDTCTFTITVEDDEAPVFSGCPTGPIMVDNDLGVCGAVVNFPTITATDTCDPSITLEDDPSFPSGSLFPIGTTTVVITATDLSNNTATCTFDVIVTDIEDPSITCPANITVDSNAGSDMMPGDCGATVDFTGGNAATATDQCPNVEVSYTPASGSFFPVGTTTVTATATDDPQGNTDTCMFTVTVVDNEDPVITGCPGDIEVRTNPGECDTVVTWTEPTASDNCPTGFTFTSNIAPGTVFTNGSTVIVYTATDAAGRQSFCEFTVHVVADFEGAVKYSVGMDPADVLTVDLGDGMGSSTPDGKPEIVSADSTGDTLTVLYNDGTGAFGSSATVMLPVGCNPSAVTSGDFIAGGGTDLAVACRDTNVILLIDNSGGSLSVMATIALASGMSPVALCAGDFNGGGGDDIGIACEGDTFGAGAGLEVILDSGAATALAIPGAAFRRPQDIDCGDLDDDGDADLVAVEIATTSSPSTSDNILLYSGDGSGGFTPAADHLDTPAGIENPQAVCVYDLDADGIVNDIAVTALDAGGIAMPGHLVTFRNNGGAPEIDPTDFDTAVSDTAGLFPIDLACCDLQCESIPGLICAQDIVVANFGSTAGEDITIFNVYECATDTWESKTPCNTGDGPTAITCGDLNCDGLPDLIIADPANDQVCVLIAVMRALAITFGEGCEGSGPMSTGGVVPQISGPMLAIHDSIGEIALSDARPNAAAVLGISSNAQAQTITGMMGGMCTIYLAPSVLTFTRMTMGDGTDSFLFSIPPAPMFNGVKFYAQYGIFDSLGEFDGIVAFSDALCMRIGF